MPARLLPAAYLTHYALGSLITVAVLPFGSLWAALACLFAAVAREVYAWRNRGWTMTRADAAEHAKDIAFTLAGGTVVLAGAFIGVCL